MSLEGAPRSEWWGGLCEGWAGLRQRWQTTALVLMLGLVLPATAVAHRRWGRLHLPICELPAGAPEPPSRDKRLAALLARVLSVSRAVMLLVTNSDGSAFAPKSLSSYLKKKSSLSPRTW